jgi:AraC-like DNA-binding protein
MFDLSSDTGSNGSARSSDVVSELLVGMRLVGLNYRRIQISPPFGLSFGGDEGRAQLHFVARGSVFLRRPGADDLALDAGAAVLLPHGGAHDLVSRPNLPSRAVTSFNSAPLCRTVDDINACIEGACHSNDTVIFSGCMGFELGSMHALVALMPEVISADTLLDRYPEILPMLEAMEREARSERAGFAGILARLAEVVSAFIVRAWVECGCGAGTGWTAALRDPRLARVIAAMHRDPGRRWTVRDLAIEMGASRSVFAERFLAVTGMTPLRYLTELRMRLAAEWIARDQVSIDDAAHRLGYGSQSAFSRAFKRVNGRAPGSLRSGAAKAQEP